MDFVITYEDLYQRICMCQAMMERPHLVEAKSQAKPVHYVFGRIGNTITCNRICGHYTMYFSVGANSAYFGGGGTYGLTVLNGETVTNSTICQIGWCVSFAFLFYFVTG